MSSIFTTTPILTIPNPNGLGPTIASISLTDNIITPNINGQSVTTFANQEGAQTLTNKTITGATNNVDANSLRNGSTWVVPMSGSSPSNNQYLKFSGGSAVWDTISVSSVPSNWIASSPASYSVGTVSQSGTTVTGVGTSFTTAMIGGIIIYNLEPANDNNSFIIDVPNSTTLTVAQTRTIASQTYNILYGGFQADTSGNASIGKLYNSNLLDTNRIINLADNTKILNFSLASATTGTTTTLSSSSTTNRTITLPDASVVLVGNSNTETITGLKTFNSLLTAATITATAYQISGTTVLSGTTLGSTIVNASITSNTGNLTNSGNINITAGNSYRIASQHMLSVINTSNSFIGPTNSYALSTGTNNSVFGFNAGVLLSTGSNNFIAGASAAAALVNGNNNVIIGSNAGTSFIAPVDCVIVGYNSGSNYTSSESNNILIGSGISGTVSESNTIRIGTGITRTFISGITGRTISSGSLVIVGSDGQMGTTLSSGSISTGPLSINSSVANNSLVINQTVYTDNEQFVLKTTGLGASGRLLAMAVINNGGNYKAFLGVKNEDQSAFRSLYIGYASEPTIFGNYLFSEATAIGYGASVVSTDNVSAFTSYKIQGTTVLTGTTLGSTIVNASITSNTGNLTNSGSINITTGNTYRINSTDVLSATTLGSAVVNASITSNTGSLTNSSNINITSGEYRIAGETFLNRPSANVINIGDTSTTSVNISPTVADKGFNVNASATGRFMIATSSATYDRCLMLSPSYNSQAKTMIGSFNNAVSAWRDLYIQDVGNTKFGNAANPPTERVDIDGSCNVSSVYKIGTNTVLSETTLGSTVVNASITSNTGNLTNSGNINITTGNTYRINSTDVLSATTLGSTVVNTSITSNTGSLTNSSNINITSGEYRIAGETFLNRPSANVINIGNTSTTSVNISPTAADKGFNVNASATGRFMIATSSATYDRCLMLSPSYNSQAKTMIGSFNNAVSVWADLYVQDGGNTKFGNASNPPTERVDIDGSCNVSSVYKIGTNTVLSGTTLGSAVVNTSITSNTGNLTNSGNINITTGNTYRINSTDVLSATTLGSGVVNASITSNTGSLTNSGNINITSGHYRIGGTRTLYNTASSGGFVLFTGNSGNLTGSGIYNHAFGNTSLSAITTADFNCTFGYNTLNLLQNGFSNCAFGQDAGAAVISGSSNCFYGQGAGQNYTSSESNNICIGQGVGGTVGESNKVRIGNTSITDNFFNGNMNITTGSAYRINSTDVLSATTLGSAVVNASITSNTGNLTNSGNINITTGNTYRINSTDVLSATTLGSAVVNASITSNTGSLTNSSNINITSGEYRIAGETFLNRPSANVINIGNTSTTSVNISPSISGDKGFNVNASATGRFMIATSSATYDRCLMLSPSYNSQAKTMIGSFDNAVTAWRDLYVQDGGNTKFGNAANPPTERVDIDGSCNVSSVYKIGTATKLSSSQLNGQNNFPASSGTLAIIGSKSYGSLATVTKAATSTAVTTNTVTDLKISQLAIAGASFSNFTTITSGTDILGLQYTGTTAEVFLVNLNMLVDINTGNADAYLRAVRNYDTVPTNVGITLLAVDTTFKRAHTISAVFSMQPNSKITFQVEFPNNYTVNVYGANLSIAMIGNALE